MLVKEMLANDKADAKEKQNKLRAAINELKAAEKELSLAQKDANRSKLCPQKTADAKAKLVSVQAVCDDAACAVAAAQQIVDNHQAQMKARAKSKAKAKAKAKASATAPMVGEAIE